jgi:hypothetical protein
MRTNDFHEPAYRPTQTFFGTAVLFAAFIAILLAASYPLLFAGAVGVALATAASVTLALDYRRRTGRMRRVCVPKTGVCVEA